GGGGNVGASACYGRLTPKQRVGCCAARRDDQEHLRIMKVLSSQIQYGVPLARYTSLGVGGPASALARAAHESHVEELVAWAKGRSLPVVVLGGGSNAVVSDAGIHGLV